MTEGAVSLRDVVEGLAVELSTQSFAARALIGSLAAALLAALAVRLGWVRSSRARRALVLAPIMTAATAAFASVGDSFLPSLVIASPNGGEVFEVFGAQVTVRFVDWFVIGYGGIAVLLLLRRFLCHMALAAYVRRAVPCDDPGVEAIVRRLATKLEITAPPVLLLESCPGGGFTTGVRRPVVAIDPALVASLDDRELEGLLAHELAHVKRRDVALNIGLGVLRDLTFFVAPLHTAARWLRQDQERAADDAASAVTGRPAALASSILKVWQGTSRRRVPAHGRASVVACATMVPSVALPVPAGMPGRLVRQGGLRGGAREIARRVVRLIEAEAAVSRRRERIEVALTASVIALAAAATVIVLPATLAGNQLWLGGLSRPEAVPVESPAFATFRALSPAPAASPTVDGDRVAEPPCYDCLVLESPADWRSAIPPREAQSDRGWPSEAHIWDDTAVVQNISPRAEPLIGLDASNSRFGIFLVNRDR